MKGSLKTKMRFSGCLIAIGRRRGGKPGSVVDSHSSRPAVADRFEQPTRTLGGPRRCVLFGLAADGVWPAAPVASRAVRSYRTFSPLPVPPFQAAIGGFAFCSTFRHVAMLPCAARTFLPAAETARRLSALPARGGLYRLRGSLKGGAVLLGSVRNIAKPCRPVYNADVFLVRQSCFQAAWIF